MRSLSAKMTHFSLLRTETYFVHNVDGYKLFLFLLLLDEELHGATVPWYEMAPICTPLFFLASQFIFYYRLLVVLIKRCSRKRHKWFFHKGALPGRSREVTIAISTENIMAAFPPPPQKKAKTVGNQGWGCERHFSRNSGIWNLSINIYHHHPKIKSSIEYPPKFIFGIHVLLE